MGAQFRFAANAERRILSLAKVPATARTPAVHGTVTKQDFLDEVQRAFERYLAAASANPEFFAKLDTPCVVPRDAPPDAGKAVGRGHVWRAAIAVITMGQPAVLTHIYRKLKEEAEEAEAPGPAKKRAREEAKGDHVDSGTEKKPAHAEAGEAPSDHADGGNEKKKRARPAPPPKKADVPGNAE